MRQHIRKATTLGLAVAAAMAGISLTACGGQSDAQFNASFDKSTHDSCVSSFTSKGGPADKAETYCTCVVKELDKYSVADKMSLALHQEKLTAVAQTCIAQMNGSPPEAANATP